MTVFFVYYENGQTPDNVKALIAALIEGLSIPRSQLFNVAEAPPESISASPALGSTWVLHNTATYFPAYTERLLEKVKSLNPKAPIIVMKQDDHLAPGEFDDLFVRFEVSSVSTYLDPTQAAIVYPKATANGISFTRVHVGYLTQSLREMRPKPLGSILKGSYRGSFQPVSLGKLGFDKAMLPSRIFSQIPAMSSEEWIFDVSSDWRERVYGRAWEDLLVNSRLVFTTESGSNCFDLDGSLGRRTEGFEQLNGRLNWDEMDLVDRYFDEVVADFEGNVQGGTFSPRNLEAGILGRPQVAIEGSYGGLFDGFESQLFLKQDLSNLSNLMIQFSDVAVATSVAADFRESLLARDDLRVENFTASILRSIEQAQDATIGQPMAPLGGAKRGERVEVLILSPSPYEADPRTEWWAESLESLSLECLIFEWLGDEDVDAGWRVVGRSSKVESRAASSHEFDVSNPALLMLLLALRESKSVAVAWRARRILKMLRGLANVSRGVLPQGIIACDLESAVIANILWGDSAVIIYDAQEMPVEQLDEASDVGRAQFAALERATVRESDLTVTVSAGAAEYFYEAYGITPLVVPNFVPRNLVSGTEPEFEAPSRGGEIVRFVFFGRFSPGRAIERMIEDWPADPARRELHIFAEGFKRASSSKDREHRQKGVFVCDPVPVEGLRGHLQNFDVGIIPYDYGYPYNHASPNKFGQYLDSGLAIVSTDTPFVGEWVVKLELGEVFTWRDPEGYQRAVDKMTVRFESGSEAATRPLSAARSALSWEAFAEPVLEEFIAAILNPRHDKNSVKRDFVPHRVGVLMGPAESVGSKLVDLLYSLGVENTKFRRMLQLTTPRPLLRLLWARVVGNQKKRSLDVWEIPG